MKLWFMLIATGKLVTITETLILMYKYIALWINTLTWWKVKYPTIKGETNPAHTLTVPVIPWITPINNKNVNIILINSIYLILFNAVWYTFYWQKKVNIDSFFIIDILQTGH